MPLNPRISNWTGLTVWLIGASTGIGRATAARLHGLGAQVIVSARNDLALRAFVAQHPGSEFVARRNELWNARGSHADLSPSGRFEALSATGDAA